MSEPWAGTMVPCAMLTWAAMRTRPREKCSPNSKKLFSGKEMVQASVPEQLGQVREFFWVTISLSPDSGDSGLALACTGFDWEEWSLP